MTDGLVPQRQAPPPPRPSTSSSKSLSLQLSAGSVPQSPPSSYGSTPASPLHHSEHNINPKEANAQSARDHSQPQVPAPPRVPPPKKGPPPPQKPSRHNNDYRSPQDSMRSYPTENTISLTTHHHHTSSPKSSYSSRSHQHYDSSEYPSNRSTFKGVFSNIVNSMTGTDRLRPCNSLTGKTNNVFLTNPGSLYLTRCLLSFHSRSPCPCAFLDLLSSDKKMEISSPYNPVHLTHVGYNLDTGEFTVRNSCLTPSFLTLNRIGWLAFSFALVDPPEHNMFEDWHSLSCSSVCFFAVATGWSGNLNTKKNLSERQREKKRI